MKNNPIARKSELVVQKAGNELLIYDLKNNQAFCLNETSTVIWQLCNGRRSSRSIAKEASKALGNQCSEEAVKFAVYEFQNQSLLSNTADKSYQSAKVSRRELIQKIGFGSVVALPIISSIVAPDAVSAMSCVNPGGEAPGFAVARDPVCGRYRPRCCSDMTVLNTNDCITVGGGFGNPPRTLCLCECG